MTGEESREAPEQLAWGLAFLRPPERVPEVPVVSPEHLPQLEKIQEVLPSRRAEEGHWRGRHWAGGNGGTQPGMEVQRLPFPPDPHSARRPPPSRAAPHPLPPERPLGPTAGPGHATFQTSFPPYLLIPRGHGWRRGSGAGWVRRGHRTALGTDQVNDPSAGSATETLSADLPII